MSRRKKGAHARSAGARPATLPSPAPALSESPPRPAGDVGVRSLLDVLEELALTQTRWERAAADRDRLVDEARSLGGSWSVIARATNLTPQGAHSRWRT